MVALMEGISLRSAPASSSFRKTVRPPLPSRLHGGFLIDTDLLSMLERKQVPLKLENWIQNNEPDIFLSVVSLAGLHTIKQFSKSLRPSDAEV
jgi:hypothetical protein